MKSTMCRNGLSHVKTSPAPVQLDSENYSSTFYSLSKELNFGRKNGEQKNYNMRNICNSMCIVYCLLYICGASSLPLKLRYNIMQMQFTSEIAL